MESTERLDDLMTHGLQIIQSDQVFRFSLDAVLLARFCRVPARGRVVDLCSGNGVVPLLLSTRTKAQMIAVEIQEKLADMAARSVALNQLTEQIQVLACDLRELFEQADFAWAPESVDLVTVNPPYLPLTGGELNENPHIAAARHELFCTLADVVGAAARLLRPNGQLAIVHRPNRLAELIDTLLRNQLQPKRMRLVYPRADAEANMVLLEAVKYGKSNVRCLPPLIVHEGTGYSAEVARIFYPDSDSDS